ncbi:galactose oxidase [Rhizophagus irregularis]|uniref:Galactose oxidase n=1 Tax=Rhizophagus irregularis TaxID=588596 RepID=A0A2N0PBT9_9GLOM|nr:galactose oxidase [Rhizophagus irregularis]CAB5390363.1 unnamed protein product [Rhizophagus irregularis]
MTPYKPIGRSRHTATLVDDKLYILGGDYKSLEVGKDFFYLDVSVPFITQNLLWKDLSSINTVPSHYDAISVNDGENNNRLFLYGGIVNVTVTDFVYIFNPQNNTWSVPQITDNIPLIFMKKSELTGIIDRNGKMYLWSGLELFGKNIKNIYLFNNDMLILDTKKLIWELGSSFDAPTARTHYGATLLPDGRIIYMGGFKSVALTLNQVYLYDTINDSWSSKTTSGKVPSGRGGFSAVLGLDGQRIIIYGGTTTITNDKDLTPEDSLYELNVINFGWRIPNISGKIPKSRLYHKANVIGKYMVITFGLGYDQLTERDILLLDIGNAGEYIWTNEFYDFYHPSSPQSGKVPPSPSAIPPSIIVQSQSTPSMTGAIIGSLIGGATLSSVGFLLYIWNKNRQKSDNNNNQEEKYIYNHGREIEQIPKNEYITNHEPISAPDSIINNCSNHGQESIPIVDDNRLTLHELKQEIQDLRQIITQSNKQSTNPIK